jgi:hypothetical protein
VVGSSGSSSSGSSSSSTGGGGDSGRGQAVAAALVHELWRLQTLPAGEQWAQVRWWLDAPFLVLTGKR